MLLGRTANGLYWMNRYIERAENMARIVDTGLRLALTRTSSAADEWASVVYSAGVGTGFEAKYKTYDADNVSDFLLRDQTNPSSVMASIDTARSNARMVRTALTRETWESINEAWMSLKRALARPIDQRELPQLLDQIKRETAQIRGAFSGTMLRNEIYNFSKIGTLIERHRQRGSGLRSEFPGDFRATVERWRPLSRAIATAARQRSGAKTRERALPRTRAFMVTIGPSEGPCTTTFLSSAAPASSAPRSFATSSRP